jgi:Zn ribbon nucleic-acid-binding protein
MNIKNCPCCGGEADIFEENFGNVVWVQCTECGLQTSRYNKEDIVSGLDGEQWALFRWNERKG